MAGINAHGGKRKVHSEDGARTPLASLVSILPWFLATLECDRMLGTGSEGVHPV